MAAYDSIKSHCKALWLVEVKVLKGRFGAVDIYVPALKPAIKIDGEQHLLSDIHSNSFEQQIELDDRFNQAAMQQNISVLRLQWEDSSRYSNFITKALQQQQSQPEKVDLFTSLYMERGEKGKPHLVSLLLVPCCASLRVTSGLAAHHELN